MVLVGVMSDSHDNMANVEKAFNIFREHGVEAIIHLGDIISPFIVKKMAELSWSGLMVYAVYGNNDGDKPLLYRLFSEKGWSIWDGPRVIEVGGKKLLLMHGYNGIEHTREIAYSTASSYKGLDAVLYGHTHKRDHRVVDGVLVLNPGETYGYLFGEPSIAILDLEEMKVEFIEL